MKDHRQLPLRLLPLFAFIASFPMTIASSDGPGWFADSDGWQGFEVAFLWPLIFLLVDISIDVDIGRIFFGLCLLAGTVSVFLYLAQFLYSEGVIPNDRNSKKAVACIGWIGLAGALFALATFNRGLFLWISLIAAAVSLFLYVGRIVFETDRFRALILVPSSFGLLSAFLVFTYFVDTGIRFGFVLWAGSLLGVWIIIFRQMPFPKS